MDWGRTGLSALIALSLVACGGDDGPPPPASTPTPPPVATCSLEARKDWTFAQIDDFYLFPNLIDRDAPRDGTVQDYIDRLVAPARAEGKDRGFTYITSIQEENEFRETGSSAGFGFRLTFNGTADRLYVMEAFESGPAFQAGFDRGDRILAINGETIGAILQRGGIDALIEALGPDEPGVSRVLTRTNNRGVNEDLTVTKTEFELEPLSDRYGIEILEDSFGNRVGYVMLRTFSIDSAREGLRSGFDTFRREGITNVILDFRYNGGGLVSIAELLGDLLGRDYAGQVFSRTVFRDSLSSENSTSLFQLQPEAITVEKLAVIGTDWTASASEMVPNSFIPYLGGNIALIGSNTFGKPVGQIGLDREACDDRLRLVAFKTVNANGQGEYYNGLAEIMPVTCRAADDIFNPLGSPYENSISTALAFFRDGECDLSGPIYAARDGVQQPQAVEQGRGPLEDKEPSVAQRYNPGLF